MKKISLILFSIMFCSSLSAKTVILEAEVGGIIVEGVPRGDKIEWKDVNVIDSEKIRVSIDHRAFTLLKSTEAGYYQVQVNLHEFFAKTTTICTAGQKSVIFEDDLKYDFYLVDGDEVYVSVLNESGQEGRFNPDSAITILEYTVADPLVFSAKINTQSVNGNDNVRIEPEQTRSKWFHFNPKKQELIVKKSGRYLVQAAISTEENSFIQIVNGNQTRNITRNQTTNQIRFKTHLKEGDRISIRNSDNSIANVKTGIFEIIAKKEKQHDHSSSSHCCH